MAGKRAHIDSVFLGIVVIIVTLGFLVFISATLGLLGRSTDVSLSRVLFTQIVFGLIGGGLALAVLAFADYRIFMKLALPGFILAVCISLLVFVPGIGLELKGASRWLVIGPFSFQPSELLKVAYVVLLASVLMKNRTKLREFTKGLLPFLVTSGIVAGVLVLQRDTDTLVITIAAGVAMYLAAGAPWRDIVTVILIGIIGLAAIAFMRPYVMEHILTFVSPAADAQGSGYQIQQSLIAIGSGELFGRGFGQSVQKFSYLPEPIGDSIFAVLGEEFGFVGAAMAIFLFLLFAIRGYTIGKRAADMFGSSLAIGITTLIIAQAYWNMAAMLGLVPLSGLPLVFVSHGGTALLVALASCGLVLSVSRRMTR